MELVFVTNNKHKLSEIRAILGDKYKILSLSEIDFHGEIPETSDTIAGNSLQKTKYIYDRYKIDCFGDDTGLEIEALGGRPGVYSARYAGEDPSFSDNMLKVMSEMQGKSNRKARFVTVITLFMNGQVYQFEGVVEGQITISPMGTNGFGYDPIFKPDGYEQTYAQMSNELKNKISHRAVASEKLIEFLRKM